MHVHRVEWMVFSSLFLLWFNAISLLLFSFTHFLCVWKGRDCFNAAKFLMYAEEHENMDLTFVCKTNKQFTHFAPCSKKHKINKCIAFCLCLQWFVTQKMEIMGSEFKGTTYDLPYVQDCRWIFEFLEHWKFNWWNSL